MEKIISKTRQTEDSKELPLKEDIDSGLVLNDDGLPINIRVGHN